MTKKECNEQLRLMKAFIGYDKDSYVVKRMQTALDMAIQALEQQPSCEDAVSRQALIDKATSWDAHFTDSEKAVSLTDIMSLPSVQPQQTNWIPCSERLPEENISVIGTTKYNDIYETELYNDCGKHKWYADGNYDVPIVAWIPLPEPYSESEDEG